MLTIGNHPEQCYLETSELGPHVLLCQMHPRLAEHDPKGPQSKDGGEPKAGVYPECHALSGDLGGTEEKEAWL